MTGTWWIVFYRLSTNSKKISPMFLLLFILTLKLQKSSWDFTYFTSLKGKHVFVISQQQWNIFFVKTLAILKLYNTKHHYKMKHSSVDDLFPLYWQLRKAKVVQLLHSHDACTFTFIQTRQLFLLVCIGSEDRHKIKFLKHSLKIFL